MADITRGFSDPPTCHLTMTRTEAVVVLLALSLTADRAGTLPQFVTDVANSLDATLRPVVVPPGTLVSELYDLLTPASAPDGEVGHGS